jgi:hypothetical protein
MRRATGWTAGIRFPAGARFFPSQRLNRLWVPPRLLFYGYRGVNLQGREPGYSLISSVEVKNGGALLPLPHKSSWQCLINSAQAQHYLYHLLVMWRHSAVRCKNRGHSYVRTVTGSIQTWNSELGNLGDRIPEFIFERPRIMNFPEAGHPE